MTMGSRPWLSVAMPIHCGERDLSATLDSVVAERPDGVELLIYDSTPNDLCRNVIDRYRSILNIRYVNARPSGWPAKTNLAVEQAAAPHVAMLHHDDLWLPGHLNAVRQSIAESPHAAMHVASSRLIDADGRDMGSWSLPMRPGLHDGDAFARALLVQNVVAIPAPVIRRDAWLAIGGLDETLWYAGDWDLYIKLARAGAVAVRSGATTAFRLHATSLTMVGSRDAAAFRDQLAAVLDRHMPATDHRIGRGIRRRAQASIDINHGLALLAAGRHRGALAAFVALIRLGPVGAMRYQFESRILDRILPRVRLRLSGAL